MKHYIFLSKRGFTLLEVLLVVVALGFLILVSLTLLDPNEQLNRVEKVTRGGDMQVLESALKEYHLMNRMYPENIPNIETEICDTGSLSEDSGSPDCDGLVDLRALVPHYITSIPVSNYAEGNGTGYTVFVNISDTLVIREID